MPDRSHCPARGRPECALHHRVAIRDTTVVDTKRPIVITPYYKEDPSLLRRCMESVRNQTVPTEHFMVADGHPQDWIDAEPVRHLKLDRSHRDYGNTPRGI